MSNNIPVNGWPQLKDLEAVQPILNRLDKIEAWKRTVKEETFTGDDITIENALALPARSLITEINAIQDLHGLPFPYVGGAYKNKVETPSETAFAACGITLTTASNGETTLNGTSTAGSIDGDTFELPAGTYTISVGTTLPSGVWVSLDGVGGAMISPTAKSISFTATEAINTFTHIYVNAGVAFNNFKLNWMLEEGSTATSYAPYSNICPISGRTAARVDDDGANLANKSAVSANASGAIATSAGTIFTAVEANKSYVLSFNLKEKMSASSLQNRRLSLYLNDSVSLYQWTDADTSGRQRITITPTASGYLNFWAGADVFSANTEIIDDIYLTDITTTATIQLGTTVYGAEINWDTGVATVLDAIADMGDLTWSYNSTSQVFNSSALPGATTENVYTDAISSSYKEHQTGMSAMVNGDFRVLDGVMTVKDTAYTDATAFKTAVTGQTVCYKLATPIELTLTPTEVQMLKGYNHITLSDGYGTIELKALTGANWS